MNLADLPPLREALGSLGADKRLGQNFLLDLNICRKIVRIADISKDDIVLEVGPGPGGLTRSLLEAGARVVAVEKDDRFLPLLVGLAGAADERLALLQADALTIDEVVFVGPGAKVVANLPYNVATPLLVKWLTGGFRPVSITAMFQDEVARRIVAAPGGRDYGRLSVICQAIAHARIAMTLPPRAFTPPPKVNSAVVRLEPRAERPSDAEIALLQRITAAAFGQRRKMLRSSLRALGGAEFCALVNVDPSARAETVGVSVYLAMARLLADQPPPISPSTNETSQGLRERRSRSAR